MDSCVLHDASSMPLLYETALESHLDFRHLDIELSRAALGWPRSTAPGAAYVLVNFDRKFSVVIVIRSRDPGNLTASTLNVAEAPNALSQL